MGGRWNGRIQESGKERYQTDVMQHRQKCSVRQGHIKRIKESCGVVCESSGYEGDRVQWG